MQQPPQSEAAGSVAMAAGEAATQSPQKPKTGSLAPFVAGTMSGFVARCLSPLSPALVRLTHCTGQ